MGVEPTTATLAMRHPDTSNPGNSRAESEFPESVAQRLPADLAGLAEAWDELPPAIRKAVLALVGAVSGSG